MVNGRDVREGEILGPREMTTWKSGFSFEQGPLPESRPKRVDTATRMERKLEILKKTRLQNMKNRVSPHIAPNLVDVVNATPEVKAKAKAEVMARERKKMDEAVLKGNALVSPSSVKQKFSKTLQSPGSQYQGSVSSGKSPFAVRHEPQKDEAKGRTNSASLRSPSYVKASLIPFTAMKIGGGGQKDHSKTNSFQWQSKKPAAQRQWKSGIGKPPFDKTTTETTTMQPTWKSKLRKPPFDKTTKETKTTPIGKPPFGKTTTTEPKTTTSTAKPPVEKTEVTKTTETTTVGQTPVEKTTITKVTETTPAASCTGEKTTITKTTVTTTTKKLHEWHSTLDEASTGSYSVDRQGKLATSRTSSNSSLASKNSAKKSKKLLKKENSNGDIPKSASTSVERPLDHPSKPSSSASIERPLDHSSKPTVTPKKLVTLKKEKSNADIQKSASTSVERSLDQPSKPSSSASIERPLDHSSKPTVSPKKLATLKKEKSNDDIQKSASTSVERSLDQSSKSGSSASIERPLEHSSKPTVSPKKLATLKKESSNDDIQKSASASVERSLDQSSKPSLTVSTDKSTLASTERSLDQSSKPTVALTDNGHKKMEKKSSNRQLEKDLSATRQSVGKKGTARGRRKKKKRDEGPKRSSSQDKISLLVEEESIDKRNRRHSADDLPLYDGTDDEDTNDVDSADLTAATPAEPAPEKVVKSLILEFALPPEEGGGAGIDGLEVHVSVCSIDDLSSVGESLPSIDSNDSYDTRMNKILQRWVDLMNEEEDEPEPDEISFTTDVELEDNILDHIVLAAPDLTEALEEFEKLTGIKPSSVGALQGLGARTAHIGMDQNRYIEILAPDPNDNGALGKELKALDRGSLTPFHYAIRSTEMSRLVEGYVTDVLGWEPDHVAMVQALADNSIRQWDVLTTYGHGIGGIAPYYVKWKNAHVHPTGNIPIKATLKKFNVRAPKMHDVHKLIVGVNGITVETGEPRLQLFLETPKGVIIFSADKPRGLQFPGFGEEEALKLGMPDLTSIAGDSLKT